MTQQLDPTVRITRRRSHPVPPRPALNDPALFLVCGLLRANGMTVLEHDWRWGGRPIGVVAQDRATLCFVAVARSTHQLCSPQQLVDEAARRELRSAAGQWLCTRGTRGPVNALRFDLVCAFLGPGGAFDLRHHRGAA